MTSGLGSSTPPWHLYSHCSSFITLAFTRSSLVTNPYEVSRPLHNMLSSRAMASDCFAPVSNRYPGVSPSRLPPCLKELGCGRKEAFSTSRASLYQNYRPAITPYCHQRTSMSIPLAAMLEDLMTPFLPLRTHPKWDLYIG